MKKTKIYLKEIGDINKNLIPEKEYLKIKKYLSLKKKEESLSGLTLLGSILKNKGIDDYELKYNNFNKPYLANSPYYFSISHSNKYVVCTLMDEEVGIDIERVSKRITKLERKITKTTNNNEEELTKIWVLKEAFVKYLGIGLSINVKEIKLNIINDKENIYQVNYFKEKGYAKVVRYEDYYIALCIKNIEKLDFTLIKE